MTNLTTNIKAILGIIVVCFCFIYFFYCAWTAVKPDPSITIAAVASLGTVLGYFFGSSVGSAAKDAVIANVINSSPPITPEPVVEPEKEV